MKFGDQSAYAVAATLRVWSREIDRPLVDGGWCAPHSGAGVAMYVRKVQSMCALFLDLGFGAGEQLIEFVLSPSRSWRRNVTFI